MMSNLLKRFSEAFNVGCPSFGLLIIALAYFLFSISNATAKGCIKNIPPIEIFFIRQTIMLVMILSVLKFFKRFHLLSIRHLHEHCLRAIFGGIGIIFCFTSYKFLPIASATAIIFSNSIFLVLLTPLVLHEHIKPYVLWSVLIGLSGVTVIINPNESVSIKGALFALGAGLFDALGLLYVRILSRKVHVINIPFYFALFSIVGCLLLFILEYELPGILPLQMQLVCPSFSDTLTLLIVGVFGATSLMLMPMGLKLVAPAIASPMMYTSMIWMALFGYVFWDEEPERNFYLGSVLIILSGIIITVVEVYKDRKKKRHQPN